MLVTTTVKVKVPPGSGRLSGLAVLSTRTVGRTLMRLTVASSVSVATVPFTSVPVTVTMSVWQAPPTPVKVPVKAQA